MAQLRTRSYGDLSKPPQCRLLYKSLPHCLESLPRKDLSRRGLHGVFWRKAWYLSKRSCPLIRPGIQPLPKDSLDYNYAARWWTCRCSNGGAQCASNESILKCATAGHGWGRVGLCAEPGAGRILQRSRLVLRLGRSHHAPGLVLEPPRPRLHRALLPGHEVT